MTHVPFGSNPAVGAAVALPPLGWFADIPARGAKRPDRAHLDRSRVPGRTSNADVRRPINLSENRCADSEPNREIKR